MLALVAAVLAAATAAPAAPALEASVPWWERISVTIDHQGKQQACHYQSSLSSGGPEACEQEMAATIPPRASGTTGLYSKLTFERRFSPGSKLDPGRLQAGDKLLGQQVLFLTIGSDGSIASCRVVDTSGDMLPGYGCAQAKTEQFRAQASAPSEPPRQAFMTILVYGHQEQIA